MKYIKNKDEKDEDKEWKKDAENKIDAIKKDTEKILEETKSLKETINSFFVKPLEN